MTELHITVGIPGSGKSTVSNKLFNANQIDAIVYPDSIREEMIRDRDLPGDPYCNTLVENEVWSLTDQLVKGHLQSGHRVLVDATHLTKKSRRKWLLLAKTFRAEPIAHYVDTAFSTCSNRNSARVRVVPQDVMERFRDSARTIISSVLKEEGWKVYRYDFSK